MLLEDDLVPTHWAAVGCVDVRLHEPLLDAAVVEGVSAFELRDGQAFSSANQDFLLESHDVLVGRGKQWFDTDWAVVTHVVGVFVIPVKVLIL